MAQKPIFVATHPRACSTAFERVFMTCRDTLHCVHEPFGDAWYFGQERLSDRYANDAKARQSTGFANCTYSDVFESMERENPEQFWENIGDLHQNQGKRLFIKDMAQYWMPLNGQPASIAPSLVNYKRGVGTNGDSHTNGPSNSHAEIKEPGNPTVVPEDLLRKFHFTFLIRHPRSSIPSYYRCTIPPLDKVTGFYDFRPEEAGYAELRRFFDYARRIGLVGPRRATAASTQSNGVNGTTGDDDGIEICLVDADDMLDNPSATIEAYCKSVGIEYSPAMLKWDSEEDQAHAKQTFAKWKGFHEDALDSKELKPRAHKKAPKTDAQLLDEWTEKFGPEAARVIQQTVRDNTPHYEYLKQFALKV